MHQIPSYPNRIELGLVAGMLLTRYLDSPCVASASLLLEPGSDCGRYIWPRGASVEAGPDEFRSYAPRNLGGVTATVCTIRLVPRRTDLLPSVSKCRQSWRVLSFRCAEYIGSRAYVRRRRTPAQRVDNWNHGLRSPRQSARAWPQLQPRRHSRAGALLSVAPMRSWRRTFGLRFSGTIGLRVRAMFVRTGRPAW